MVKKNKKNITKTLTHLVLLFFIILFAFVLRTYNINWDQNHHLHPDERFLTMVTNDISWPSSLSEYLGEENPLSPYNNKYNFFVYGTFPVYLVKFVSEYVVFDTYDYNNITLVGRLVSALMDAGVVLLIFKISLILFNKKTALISAFLYSIFVLPIQLSHFFTSDTFMTFFLMLSFYLLLRSLSAKRKLIYSSFSGISFGLAIASKISSVYFLPLILSVYFFLFIKKKFRQIATTFPLFIVTSFLTWRFFDPKTFAADSLFRLDSNFIANIEQLRSFNDPTGWFPPAIQWIKTTPLLFPFENMIYWGLGLTIGVLLIISVLYVIHKTAEDLVELLKKHDLKGLLKIDAKNYFLTIIIIWTIAFFIYQGVQFAKAMRYFYILYPFFAMIISLTLSNLTQNKKIIITVLLIASIYPISFMSIYYNDHARVQASEWIYENIPAGSTITCEHWDDCLPLTLESKSHHLYQIETLELFHPDSSEKWVRINNQLERADYMILSSNRLWGSIPTVPERYPLTSKFYDDLMSGDSKFEKQAVFTSRPTIPLFGIELIDDHADETFTVYDHPKVMIFKKTF